MEYLVFVTIILIIGWLVFRNKKKKNVVMEPMPDHYKNILLKHSNFYNQLNSEEKYLFEQRIMNFLHTTRITGIETNIEDEDKVLVAASAIIPVFSFPNWEYVNLNEVLLYPSAFTEKFETGTGGNIQGMVGTGYMEGKMILSKPALHAGFSNEKDKKNVGIHEFVHLIDKMDGTTDGVPQVLMEKAYTIPWIDYVQKEMTLIHELQSDVNPYGGVSKTEFFAVISEFFFERPKLLKTIHPKLYEYLTKIFTVDLARKYKSVRLKRKPGRNDPCICGSGKKYKQCCGIAQ